MHPSLFVAIDPGASGGYVIRRPTGEFSEVGAYSGPQDVWKAASFLDRVRLAESFPVVAVIEKVWASPAMGVAAAFAFGENYGQWVGGLRARRLQVLAVTPQAWQKVAAPSVAGQGPERKRALKQLAQQRHPGLKMTLAICDAVLLSDYVVEQLRSGRPLGEELP